MEIVGHTDSDGSDAVNGPLSQARADAVLSADSAAPAHVRSTSRQSGSAAVATSWSATRRSSKAQNRRVSFRVRLADAVVGAAVVIQKKICMLGGLRRRQDEPGLAVRPQHVLRQIPDDGRREDREEERRRWAAQQVDL